MKSRRTNGMSRSFVGGTDGREDKEKKNNIRARHMETLLLELETVRETNNRTKRKDEASKQSYEAEQGVKGTMKRFVYPPAGPPHTRR